MRKLAPYLFTAPALAIFLLFFIYPIGYMVYLSFTSWNLISPTKTFVGLDNYHELFSSDDFVQVMLNTISYTALSVALALLISFFLALWLNRQGSRYRFAQGAIFSPYIISLVSVSLLWMWMMDPQYGLLNFGLSLVGLPPSKWLAGTETSMLALVLVSVWKIVGYNTLVFIAGLQSIPKDIYEAAALDQTPWWRRLTRLTIPMLSPTLFFLFIINVTNAFQAFDIVQIMTQGGPANTTNMLVYFIYQNGFDFFKIGYASAAGVILLLLVGVTTILHFQFLSRKVHYR